MLAAAAMLHAVYDALWLLGFVLGLPVWIVRAIADPGFRRMSVERLRAGAPLKKRGKRVLIHAVSVGEVKAAQALVRELAASRPDLDLVVSSTTNAGMETARKTFSGRSVVRFPFDVSPLASSFLARVAPDLVVLVELEIWPNFMRAARRRGIPVAVVNGRATERSVRSWKRVGAGFAGFGRLALACVQDDVYARRFADLGVPRDRIVVTGNVKADGIRTGASAPGDELRRLLGPRDGQRTLVGGSTHDPEERLLAAAAGDARLVLVPRHLERVGSLVRDLGRIGRDPQLLSKLRAGEAPDPSRPAIVDTMGELERVYALADVAFVGGTFTDRGGQNVLEPAAQGKPVVHGPNVWNFAQEAALLEAAGASRRVEDESGLERALAEILGDPAVRDRMSKAGIAAVERQKGATSRTVAALLERCPLAGPG
jgi:3-deoxy-D-manno-octulosonic-acid transferase